MLNSGVIAIVGDVGWEQDSYIEC